MLDKLTSLNHADFRQRYQGVFGFYKGVEGKENKELLVNVTQVSGGGLSFEDRAKNKFSVRADADIVFEFVPINRKLFYYDGRVLLARRIPARQWQRGISERNSEINGVGKFYQGNEGLSFPLVESYLKKIDFLEEAKKLLAEKDCIFSEQFSVVGGEVYVFGTLIGKKNKNRITLTEPLFQQELTDTFRNLKVDMEVIGE